MSTGILTDKAMNDEGVWIARIDDKPYEVLGYVLPFLEKIEKGSPCEYTLKDGKVVKISRIKNVPMGTPTDKPGVVDVAGDAVEKAKEKMAKAGFSEPTPAKAGLPKTVTGVIKTITHDSRGLVVYLWDEKAKVPVSWPAPRDGMMAAIKAEDKVKITYEVGNPNLLIDLQIDKPKGGQTFAPRKPRVTISCTINLQNYENIKVEVEGNTAEESTKILIDTLNGFAKNPAYSATRDMIQGYIMRVFSTGGA